MPYAAPRICSRCGAVIPARTACPCRPAWEGSPQRAARGRKWMTTRRNQLRLQPICQWTEPDGTGCRLLAVTVDHIVPVAEQPPGADLYAYAGLQSLCRSHAIEKNTQDALRGKRRARGPENR